MTFQIKVLPLQVRGKKMPVGMKADNLRGIFRLWINIKGKISFFRKNDL